MKLTLINRKEEAPGVESFIFKPAESMTWIAGQYWQYKLPHQVADDRGAERFFTIASAPYEKTPMITTRFTDPKGSSFKKALKELKVGDTLEASEIEGDFVIDDPSGDYVFIAGGIGVTPFHSILKDMDHEQQPIHATLLYGNRDDQLPYKKELEDIASRNPDFHLQPILAPAKIDVETIKKYVPDMHKPIFYLSGPEPMVESLGAAMKEAGIPADHIRQDFFPGYLEQ